MGAQVSAQASSYTRFDTDSFVWIILGDADSLGNDYIIVGSYAVKSRGEWPTAHMKLYMAYSVRNPSSILRHAIRCAGSVKGETIGWNSAFNDPEMQVRANEAASYTFTHPDDEGADLQAEAGSHRERRLAAIGNVDCDIKYKRHAKELLTDSRRWKIVEGTRPPSPPRPAVSNLGDICTSGSDDGYQVLPTDFY